MTCLVTAVWSKAAEFHVSLPCHLEVLCLLWDPAAEKITQSDQNTEQMAAFATCQLQTIPLAEHAIETTLNAAKKK